MRTCPLIAILGLLLCAIAARGDKPIVIKDSEAIQYVGQEVEVRGRVVSVTTSPLGTTFINFGGDYPHQTFAGFIAAGSTIAADLRLTMIQGKIISITGKIELRDGKPEINVASADQIKGLDSQTQR
jgi:DNA/RNA endonuclease YhcR with UshA esterase domain